MIVGSVSELNIFSRFNKSLPFLQNFWMRKIYVGAFRLLQFLNLIFQLFIIAKFGTIVIFFFIIVFCGKDYLRSIITITNIDFLTLIEHDTLGWIKCWLLLIQV